MHLLLTEPGININLESIKILPNDIRKVIEEILIILKKKNFIIISTLRRNYSNNDILDFTDSLNQQLIYEKMLEKKKYNIISDINILEISKIIGDKDLDIFYNSISGTIDNKSKKQIINTLELHNRLFCEEIEKALKSCIFEHKIINILIVDRDTQFYIKEKNTCSNRVVKILFHGINIRGIIGILSTHFRDSRFGKIGKGTYFTDMIDYIIPYSRENQEESFLKIPKVGECFSFVASEIYYDKTKFEQIYEYQNKNEIVQKNGIRCCYVKLGGLLMKKEELKESKKCIFNEYVISNKAQILPLYGIILKRVEYLIIWRDYNFNDKNPNNFELNKFNIINEFHREIKNLITLMYDLKVYYIEETEEALNLIKKKIYNKIIIITNGNNNGKQFIINARKIIGANTIAGVSVFNLKSHINWIKDMKNVLLLSGKEIHQRFFGAIAGENIELLKKLRKDIIEKYKDIPHFNLREFNDNDLFNFKNFKDDGNFEDLSFK